MARFTFRHLPVGGLADVTGNFEQLEALIPGATAAVATRKTKQGIPDAIFTTVKMDGVVHDPYGLFDLTHGYYVAPETGWYQCDGVVLMEIPEAEVLVASYVAVNGVRKFGGAWVNGKLGKEGFGGSNVSGLVYCKRGDHIELVAYQHSGAERKTFAEEGGPWNNFAVVKVDRAVQAGTSITGSGGTTGAAISRSLYHSTAVLATGVLEGAPALQAGEEDKITFTTPAGGALYLIAASVSAKNGGGGRGGAALYVDGVRLTDVVAEAAPKNNAGTAGAGTYLWMFTRPTRQTATLFGWELSTSETELTTQSAEPFSLFLAEGSHTVELRLFNEDRIGGKIRERRLMVVGP